VLAGVGPALVGDTGGGTPTVWAVAPGSPAPVSGTVERGARLLETASPVAAQALGIAVVYQHLSILEDLTVAENMVYAMPRRLRPPVARISAWTAEQLARAGARIDPAARVTDLGVAERQLLEIAKALALEPRVLVLDEPTESLNPAEAAHLFAQIESITEAGTAVVYISHRLPEVLRIADRLTVLRDGETRGTLTAADVSEAEILQLMIGRSVDQAFPAKAVASADGPAPLLEVRGLSGPRFHGVDLEVAPGEIVGLAGVEGNGQREFLRALAGLLPSRGEVRVEGRSLSTGDPARSRRSGIVHLPGDRHAEGLLLPLSVRENTTLLSLSTLARRGFLSRRREGGIVSDLIGKLAIKTPSAETPVAALSGGTQQKVLFARSLLAGAPVLLADEPTRGVDAGARLEIYQLLRNVAQSGKAVVVLSTDVVELQGLCDRVVVFSRGQVVRTLEGDEISEENITGAAVTSVTHREGVAATARRALRLRRFFAGDYFPPWVLALIILALGLYTSESNDRFLSTFNLVNALLLATALALVTLGQFVVLLTGGIDLSVGPLTGLVVVVFSFFAQTGQSNGRLVLGVVVVAAVAITVGLVNVTLIRVFRVASVLATLATYIVLQGVSLLLRPQPNGFLREDVVSTLKTSWGWLPLAFLATCLLAVLCELALRFSRPGLEVRAVGSDETRAHRLGARVTLTHVWAYVLCSLFAAAGGLMLASQVGVGDPRVGTTYTLTSITAVVLGGASIFGGRGSFVGALLGALLIQEIITSTTFLQLGIDWQYYLPGLLILVGAGVYSRARRSRASVAQPEPAG
jgi:ribose transport system ATP-binding protein